MKEEKLMLDRFCENICNAHMKPFPKSFENDILKDIYTLNPYALDNFVMGQTCSMSLVAFI